MSAGREREPRQPRQRSSASGRGGDGTGGTRGAGRDSGSTSGRGGAPRQAARASARRATGTPPPGSPPPRKAPPRKATGRPTPAQPAVDVHDPDGVRLQKLLAAAGIGSRRTCEALIADGRVEVDGQVVSELGVRIDPTRQTVRVDGERVVLDENRVYLAFNKPLGVVSTMSDERGRPSIADYLGNRGPGGAARLFHVGRLDADTEGLLLLTNDGELANRLAHPAYGVSKTYLAQVPGPVPRDLGRRLRAGIELDDGPVTVDSFRLVDSAPGRALVEVVLHEGRKHVVRRLLAAVGHPVYTLARTDVGPIRLGDLKPGKTRRLTREEIAALYAAAGL
jgi:23S rRNA pseudouridine2605 synthase